MVVVMQQVEQRQAAEQRSGKKSRERTWEDV